MTHGYSRYEENRRFVTKRQLKNIIGSPERKWFNTTLLAANVLPTGTIYQLDAIAQGTGDNGRIGDTISVHNILLRSKISISGNTPTNSVVRVIIFRWLQATTPTVPDILESTTAGTQYLSPLNKNFGKSIDVMSDKTYSLSLTGTQVVAPKKYKAQRYQTEYNTGTSTTTNGTWLLVVGDTTVAASYNQYNFTSRINYTDV